MGIATPVASTMATTPIRRRVLGLAWLVAALASPLAAASDAVEARRPQLQILNGTDHTVDVFWLKSDSERVANGTIPPGTHTVISTTLGHRFVIVDREDGSEATVTSVVPVQAFRVGGVPAFYTRRTDAHGFPIVASDAVNPYALAEAAHIVDLMLAKRPDVREAMIASGARLSIIAWNEYTTDQPEWKWLAEEPVEGFRHIPARDYYDARARGMGGSETDPYCSCAEENLLCYPGDPYPTENILIHELAHNIHLRGMANVDPSFDARLQAAYDAAMRDGLWKGKYPSVNHHEYFAEGVQSWFDNNREHDHDHNHVDTRAELVAYDPRLAALCREVFGDTKLTYTKPQTRLVGHLAGYDPATAPRFEWPERLSKARQEIRSRAVARDAAANAMASRPAAAAEKPLRFDRDVRPILAEHCYACHGPGTQEAGLRLDSAEEATRELESGARAVVAGDTKASEMLARIGAADPDVVMPPPHTNKPLSAAQKELLAKWIAAGAPYERHWSFTPIVRPEVPAGDAAVTNPIDRFLEARLAAENLPVAPEADRRTLARRLSFALTGLPPTPAEVEAFVADAATDAYDKLVRRLLQSPHHGEEMARHWLDAARYADTHGLHLDNERQTWAYRDWVVKAFNDAMPFDRFTIEQLAGDLLPDATSSQKTATGFSRCNVTTSEGGSINDELLFRYAVDRTATTINAFMGMTGQCAVCHSHKFDPISQKEFYSLYAFFNSAADPGFDGNSLVTAPAIKVPTTEQDRDLAAHTARVAELTAALDSQVAAVAYTDPATLDQKPEPVAIETIWLDDDFPAGANLQGTPPPVSWHEGNTAAGVFSGRRSLDRTAKGMGQDYFDKASATLAVPGQAEIFAHVWLDPANPPKSVMLQFHAGPAAWEHRAVWGDPAAIGWGETGSASRHHVGPLPEAGKWVRLAVPAAAVGLGPDAVISGFALTQFDGHVRWDMVGTKGVVDPATDPTRSLLAWWRERTGKDKLDDVPQDLRDLVRKGPEKVTAADEIAKVRRHWLLTVWTALPDAVATIRRDLDAARKAKTDLENAIPQTFIFTDLPKMRDSFVMVRGAYDKPGDKVARGTPAFLPPLAVPEAATPNRLDLAKWLVAPEHPLTARVAANRLWQQFFGTGLVKTSEDFGLQGEPPSHPDLLDWLAAEYRDSGWDTRHVVKLIVTSRAFRRASPATPEALTADPENRLLARGPRFRLDAEQIRDNALAVSGLLVKTIGGKGVKPYQPPNIWEPVGFTGSNTATYKQDAGDALYRRSLYTFLKRTAPPPFLVNFDAPNREQFCARRERSNTPLQALQLMNDVQHVEAARALAARALAEGGTEDAARIGWLFRTVLARDPAAEEAGVVAETLAGHRARYAADEAAAAKAVAHGASQPPAGVPAAELAPWTLVATMLLNLDETLTRN